MIFVLLIVDVIEYFGVDEVFLDCLGDWFCGLCLVFRVWSKLIKGLVVLLLNGCCVWILYGWYGLIYDGYFLMIVFKY